MRPIDRAGRWGWQRVRQRPRGGLRFCPGRGIASGSMSSPRKQVPAGAPVSMRGAAAVRRLAASHICRTLALNGLGVFARNRIVILQRVQGSCCSGLAWCRTATPGARLRARVADEVPDQTFILSAYDARCICPVQGIGSNHALIANAKPVCEVCLRRSASGRQPDLVSRWASRDAARKSAHGRGEI